MKIADIIPTVDRWLTGPSSCAYTKDNCYVDVDHPTAYKFSLWGAVTKLYKGGHSKGRWPSDCETYHRLVLATHPRFRCDITLTKFNNDSLTTHEDILQVAKDAGV